MSSLPQVRIATDGGCSPNPGLGAYGAIIQFYDGDSLKAEKEVAEAFAETTNNRMEVAAAVAGLACLKCACAVTILSDSEYLVVNARERLANWIATGKLHKKKNVDLWQGLWEQLERHDVTFEHVAGHSGHELNERAHQLVTKTRLAFSKDPYWCDWCEERPAAPGIPCQVCFDLGANEAVGPPNDNQTIVVSAPTTNEAIAIDAPETDYRVLIAGSRNATDKQLVYARCLVERCQEVGYQIV
ncbi:MAG: ribonuclease H, partial [Phototrophicaceae bacterium]